MPQYHVFLETGFTVTAASEAEAISQVCHRLQDRLASPNPDDALDWQIECADAD